MIVSAPLTKNMAVVVMMGNRSCIIHQRECDCGGGTQKVLKCTHSKLWWWWQLVKDVRYHIFDMKAVGMPVANSL